MNTTQQTVSQNKMPVDNFEFDVITVLHSKLQGLWALQKYQQDAQQGGHQAFVQLAKRIWEQDTKDVQDLKQILSHNLKG